MSVVVETWTRDDIEALREGWDFEAKRAAGRDGNGKLPEDFWPTYSAMANTRGGQIVLGVKETADGALELLGITDPERVERELWNLLQNPQKVSANLLRENDVEQREVEGKRILLVHVPRASRSQRPIYLNGDWSHAYVRVGDGDRRLERDRVRRMLADAEYDTRDDRVLPKFGLTDLDPESLAAYRNLFRSNDSAHPWLTLGDRELLQQLGGWRVDRESGEEGLTVAGLLLFGRGVAIREVFPNYFLDYQERDAIDDPSHWNDRITPDGTWSGNLFDFFRRVLPRLKSELKVPFALDPDLFRKDETAVGEALREALVNALVHADYEGRSSIQIIKAREGFVLRNPGTLRLSVEEIRQGGHSDCRNRTLQRMFARIGFGEQAGSGFARILRAWREQHWVVPLISDDAAGECSTLRLSVASLFPEDVMARLRARFGERFARLDENGRLAVATAEAEARITNARLQELTTAHARDLTFLLRRLVEEGFLESHGDRRGAWYSPRVPSGRPPTSPQSLSQTPESLSQSLSQTPPSLSQTSLPEGFEDPAARIARQRWARREQVEEVVVAVCRGRFTSIREIAARLGRTPTTIRKNYIPRLVASGRLELRDPGSPTSPDQAYRTVDPAP